MKALSIKQPWASLIAHGIKDIENRSWKTNYRGKILIHAAKIDYNKYFYMSNLSKPQHNQYMEFVKLNKFNGNIGSSIIGEVEIVDCVINHPSIWAEKTKLSEQLSNKCIWNWVLANPVLYDKPILNVKGKLSFWEFNL